MKIVSILASSILFGLSQAFAPNAKVSHTSNVPTSFSGSPSPLFRKQPRLTTIKSMVEEDESYKQEQNQNLPRKVTGFGFTAIRSSIRATTGLSLTAMRTTLRALTGVSITTVVKSLLGLLPPWTRYFFQPFLILYYVPLTILKGLIGPTPTAKKEARSSHDGLVQYWKEALESAENKVSDWPVHVMADGSIKYDLEDDRMNDKIVEAVEMKYESARKDSSA